MDRAHENTVVLELKYAQVQGILATIFRVVAGPSPEGEGQRSMADVFPQTVGSAAAILPLARAATDPLLDYLDQHGIAPPGTDHTPAAASLVLVELTVDECQRLAGAGAAAVQTWDGLFKSVPSWLARLTPAHQWRAEAVEAAADWLAACRAAGVPIIY